MLSPSRLRGVARKLVAPLLVVVWLAAVAFGFGALLRHETSAGTAAPAPDRLPAVLASTDRERPTLFLFAHPRCPCTRATLRELDRIAGRCAGRIAIVVYFLAEPDLGDEWLHGGSWDAAHAIPGVDVRTDPHGAIARSVGATTSGEVRVYSTGGDLVFHGGITGSRGHSGDNPGEDAVIDLAHGRAPAVRATPAFGCALFAADEPERAP